MHYALTILDKMNGTQSDAGPRMAGSPDDEAEFFDALNDACLIGTETLTDNGEDLYAVDHGFSRAVSGILQWARRADGPYILHTVVPGYALRMETHSDDECNCEDN